MIELSSSSYNTGISIKSARMGLKTEDKVTDDTIPLDMTVDDDALEESLQLALVLQQACSAGQLEKCKELIDKGALPWQQDPQTGWSALHYAAGESGSVLCLVLADSLASLATAQTMVVSNSSTICYETVQCGIWVSDAFVSGC